LPHDFLGHPSYRLGRNRPTPANRFRGRDVHLRKVISRPFEQRRFQSHGAARNERKGRKLHSLPLSQSPASSLSRDRRSAKQPRVSSPAGRATLGGAVPLGRLDGVSPYRRPRKTRSNRQSDATARRKGGSDVRFTRRAGANKIIENPVRNRFIEPALIAK